MTETLLIQDNFELTKKIKLNFQILDENFYHGMRKELTAKKLEELSLKAYQISVPDFFGNYNNEQHFLQGLEYFLKCTDETRHRGWFFLKKILPLINKSSRLLDIGFGNGIITKWINRNFANITVMDTNHDAIRIFNTTKKLVKKSVILEKIHGSILTQKLPSNYYDLGIISHVLYYIGRNKWLETIMNVYNSVQPGGIVVIVLNGDEYGKLKLIQNFKGQLLPINDLAKKCIEIFGNENVSLFKSIEMAKTKNLLGMMHIIGFFLHDVNATASRDDVVNYANKFLKQEDDSYSIDFCQKFIVIQKY